SDTNRVHSPTVLFKALRFGFLGKELEAHRGRIIICECLLVGHYLYSLSCKDCFDSTEGYQCDEVSYLIRSNDFR
ncbi:4309_t:CDS:2, partial [Cetraspora pellucida]